jgi:peptide/nickel transport system ATP-binding protein
MTANTADGGATNASAANLGAASTGPADTGTASTGTASSGAADASAASADGTVELRLVVEDLQVLRAPIRGREAVDVVDEISFRVQPGQVLGLVGESGSGKTTMALALLGHVRRGLVIGDGKVLVDGQDILQLSPGDLQHVRGRQVAYVPQDPSSALNPTLKVGTQLREVLESYEGGPKVREERLAEMLVEVGLSTVPGILDSYPHQLSGGQQQRVGLAMAFACRPQLIVLDEPTTGLDVTTQRRVLETIRQLCESYQVAAVYISHDLAVVAEIADHVAVLYAGRTAEAGPAREVFTTPSHPYTRGLLRAIPSLTDAHMLIGLSGQPPRPGNRPPGCFFQPRCEFAVPECERGQPPMIEVSPTGHAARCLRAAEVAALADTAGGPPARPASPAAKAPLLDVRDLSATYGRKTVLHDIAFAVPGQQCVAVVGMSGSGKTTLARCLVGLHPTWGGDVTFAGKALTQGIRRRSDDQLRRIQYVSQNPYASLNPRRTVGQIVEQPLAHFEKLPAGERYERVVAALTSAALRESFVDYYPDQLSGGERQRVAIARALILEPDLLVCDEVTSALDVSVQASVVELLRSLQAEQGLSLIFITHNLPLVRSIADQVVVMNNGKICESGPVEQVLEAPKDPYTVQLMADVPKMTDAAGPA